MRCDMSGLGGGGAVDQAGVTECSSIFQLGSAAPGLPSHCFGGCNRRPMAR